MPDDVESAFQWHRASVGRGWSHPVKRHDIDALLDQSPVESLHTVWLAGRNYLTSATYFPATRIVAPNDLDPEDFLLLASGSWQGIEGHRWHPAMVPSINIYPVPSTERAAARELVIEDALPKILQWFTAIQSGPETGRTERRRIALYRQLGEVRQAGG